MFLNIDRWLQKINFNKVQRSFGVFSSLDRNQSKMKQFTIFKTFLSEVKSTFLVLYIFSDVYNHKNYSGKFMLLKWDFFKMKISQCHVIEGRSTVKTCFSNATADYSSLDECCIIFGLNCNFTQQKYVIRYP